MARESGDFHGFKESTASVGAIDFGFNAVGQLRRQAKSNMNGLAQVSFEVLVVESDCGLKGRYHVTDDIFGSVMQECREFPFCRPAGLAFAAEISNENAMLRDGKTVSSGGLTVPSCNPRKPVCNIFDFDIDGRRVKQIEPTPA